ncbi:MAG: glycosyltransferase, partial [Bacillota bacterium]|nr:glycosyltransferase [Bacillota bacterium]
MIKCINIISDSNIGGAGKVLLSYLQNCDREDFDHAVIVPRGSLLIQEIQALGIRVIEFDGMADKSYDKKDVKGLMTLLRQEAPDVVHCHGALSGRIAASRCGIKTVHTRHSIFDQPTYKKRFPMKQILGAVNNRYGDVIIAVSPAAKDNIVEIGTDPNKVEVVFNGIPHPRVLTAKARKEVRAKYSIADHTFICAIIARLEEVKGHHYVLEAAKLLAEQGENVTIIIAGTGSREEALREEAKSMGLTNVIFTGFIKTIWEIENIMDLQLNASYGTEATSISLLEGMSLGIPAAVSDFGGNPYVIEDG